MFLAEGLAVAVSGGRSYAALREELADGNGRLPLARAIALGSLWSGQPDELVQLAYLEAGSVMLYVLDGWGPDRVARLGHRGRRLGPVSRGDRGGDEDDARRVVGRVRRGVARPRPGSPVSAACCRRKAAATSRLRFGSQARAA